MTDTVEKINVLFVGSGGREHALGWKVKQSPRCGTLYFLTGNGGTSAIGVNIPFSPPDWQVLPDLVRQFNIGLVIIGPEAPLAEGVVDTLRAAGIPVVGPTKGAAKLETSKAFAKRGMEDWGVPTAPFQIFHELNRAEDYVRAQHRPLYVKASGLCAGKGAYPCYTAHEAAVVLHRLMEERVHGSAGDEVVIEQFLEGREISVHAFCDGVSHVIAPTTQDHKKLLEDGSSLPDGTNPNTGGMGAFGPVPGITESDMDNIDLIVNHTLHGLKLRVGDAYTGILYPGLMMTGEGPKVLEYNIRGGDPETQVLMRLLKSDALDLFEMVATGTLGARRVEWHDDLHAACVVLVSDGYPGKYGTGFPISGLRAAQIDPQVVIFHAGTKESDGNIVTAGGRVLNVTATGKTLGEALERAYKAISHIEFHGMRYRRDIGKKALTMA